MTRVSDADLSCHIAGQIVACEALLPTVAPHWRTTAERALLALTAARSFADAGHYADARVVLMLGMSDLLNAAFIANAE